MNKEEILEKIKDLENKATNTRNESEKGRLFGEAAKLRSELNKVEEKPTNFVPNKEAPARMDHEEFTGSRGTVVVNDESILFGIE